MPNFSAYVMALTPFDQAGRIDEQALRAHLMRLRDAKVSVYVGSSASGEGFSLSPRERDEILRIAVDELKGRVAVRAMGIEPRNLDETVAYLKRARSIGVDAAHIFALDLGHGARLNLAELEAYYNEAIGSTSLPIVISSFDSMNTPIPLTLLEALAARFENLIGYVYGGANLAHLAEVIHTLGDRLEVHCAGPSNAMTTLHLGGTGFIGHEGNLSPVLIANVLTAFERGDSNGLRESFRKLMIIHTLHRAYGGGRAMKPLLNSLGLPGGALRPPRIPIAGSALEAVIQATLELQLPGLPAADALAE